MATHSSVLAWKFPGTAEPGELPSMGSHRVGHDSRDLAAAAAALSTEREALLCIGHPHSLNSMGFFNGPSFNESTKVLA